jgi:hypothetical protein
MKTYDVEAKGATLTVDIDEHGGNDWSEGRITAYGNLIELLQWVAEEGWDAYDEIMQRVNTARLEEAAEPM